MLRGRGEQLTAGSERAVHARQYIPYFIFAFSVLAYLYPFMRFLLQSGDEGTFLYGAVRVTQGQVPFRDFFEVTGLASFYWLALFFKLFGTTIATTRVLLALTTLCTALIMYFLARRLKTGYDAVPAVLFLATSFGAVWPAISPHNDGTLFALLSFAAVISWLDRGRSAVLTLAGVLTGLTTCFTQPKGILFLVAFVVLIFIRARKSGRLASLALFSGGYLAVVLAVVVFYWRAGALPDLIYANFTWPLTRYNTVNTVPYAYGIFTFHWTPPINALRQAVPLPVATGIAVLVIAPFVFVAGLPAIMTLFALRYKRFAFTSLTLPYWLAGTALWLSEIHRKDITHLVSGSPLLLILAFYFLGRQRGRPNVQCVQVICIATFALAAFNVLATLAMHTRVDTPRGAFYTARFDPILDFLDNHIKPEEEIFAYPYCPMYYFLTEAKNPTRYSILMYGINTDVQFEEAVRSLEKNTVRYVIWDRSFFDILNEGGALSGWPAYAHLPKHKLIIEPYLAKYYRLLQSANGIQLLERKDDVRRPSADVLQTSSLARFGSDLPLSFPAKRRLIQKHPASGSFQ